MHEGWMEDETESGAILRLLRKVDGVDLLQPDANWLNDYHMLMVWLVIKNFGYQSHQVLRVIEKGYWPFDVHYYVLLKEGVNPK